jgi:hypothetical protein
VDVTSAPATLSAEFNVTETGSGLDLLDFNLGNAAASQFHTTKAELLGPGSSGPGSGHYRATIQIPAGSAAGVWSASVFARDEVSNYSQTASPLTVVDRSPITSRPQAVSASLTPGAAALAQAVTVHLTSAGAAITGADVEVQGPSQQSATYYLALTSGTNLDGVWTGTIQLPANAAAGRWSVGYFGVTDELGLAPPLDSELPGSPLPHSLRRRGFLG